MSIMVATGRAAMVGVLFRDATAIERMRDVDTLVVDETGTLTEGKPRVTHVVPTPGFDRKIVLHEAASLERASEHPLALTILNGVDDEDVTTVEPRAFSSRTGRGVAGDGVDEAPALAVADVGIAVGTGTDAAMESAGVTLAKGDLLGIVRARHTSRLATRNIRENLFFAFVYDALGGPVAAGLRYPTLGVLLDPMIAAAAMSMSAVSVIANGLRPRSIER